MAEGSRIAVWQVHALGSHVWTAPQTSGSADHGGRQCRCGHGISQAEGGRQRRNWRYYDHPGLYAQRFDGVDKSAASSSGSENIRRQQAHRRHPHAAGENPMLLIQAPATAGRCAGLQLHAHRHFNADGHVCARFRRAIGGEGDFAPIPIQWKRTMAIISHAFRLPCLTAASQDAAALHSRMPDRRGGRAPGRRNLHR